MNKWIIVTGTFSSGLSFTGPFDTFEAAQDYAMRNGFDVYEVCELTEPE